ncbi:MAG TPA: DUF3247 family protein [Lysobacter sp.]|nr:DUF3247 family protein [Lysobacter sp.]
MTRNAERVHTDPAEIARIQQQIEQLPNGAHVSLRMEDGSQVDGIVAARPVAQVFFGPDGEEGTNAVLRLEQPAMYHPETARVHDVWVDRILAIKRLDPEGIVTA